MAGDPQTRNKIKQIKDLVTKDTVLDMSNAESLLRTLLAEHRQRYPVDDFSYNSSERGIIQHALRHVIGWRKTDTQRIKDKMQFILSLEPEAEMPTVRPDPP